jgi:hypothetical protein
MTIDDLMRGATSRSLRLHDTADLELNEAADVYDLESPELGDAFLDDSVCVDVIRVLAVAHETKRPYYWRGRS